jgi:hypothetical protein
MQSAASTTGQTPPRLHRAGAPLVLNASVPAAEPSAPLASAALAVARRSAHRLAESARARVIRDRQNRFPLAA